MMVLPGIAFVGSSCRRKIHQSQIIGFLSRCRATATEALRPGELRCKVDGLTGNLMFPC